MSIGALLILALAIPSGVLAQQSPGAPVQRPPVPPGYGGTATPSTPANTSGYRVDVEAIKQRYWARGDQNELRVVQNRTYSKANSIELSVFGGKIAGDPFFSTYNYGASLGYHFSEYFALDAIYWSTSVGKSSALDTLETTGDRRTANSNNPKSFKGASLLFSPFYGKLSVFGWSIIYFDIHLLGGAGLTDTESGSYFTPFIGIGQQVYLSRRIAIRLDFRQTYYNEQILDKANGTGTLPGTRANWSEVVTLGVSFFPFSL